MSATYSAAPETFRFDPARHRYTLGDRELISVTQALHLAGLIDDAWYTEFARQPGAYVHQMLDWFIRGRLDETTLDPILQPYLAAYRRCDVEAGLRCTRNEQRLLDATRLYAGTVDWIGFVGDKPAIIDFKTGGPEHWHRLQIAAYHALVTQTSLPAGLRGSQIRRYGLYLRSNGDYRLEPYTDRTDTQVWFSALATAQWKAKVTHGHRCA